MTIIANALAQDSTETILSSAQQLKAQFPLASHLAQQVYEHRHTIEQILSGKDSRLMVITGPCSIHDPVAIIDYAKRLKALQAQVADKIVFVLRAYIEKPRTTVGWKGFLYDPNLDGSGDMKTGLEQSRHLFLQLLEIGLPLATEILNPMATGYFDDLLAWGAIGARTSESQIHREISSHMPYSIGFKNGTDGSIQIALDAISAAAHSHQFMGLGQQGVPSIISSIGNPHPHLILRGSNTGANYSADHIAAIANKVGDELPALIIDCSHGNSSKNPLNQPDVLRQIVAERAQTQVKGVMLESHLVDGQQKISAHMQYGQSVTDGCLGWEKTQALYLEIAARL